MNINKKCTECGGVDRHHTGCARQREIDTVNAQLSTLSLESLLRLSTKQQRERRQRKTRRELYAAVYGDGWSAGLLAGEQWAHRPEQLTASLLRWVGRLPSETRHHLLMTRLRAEFYAGVDAAKAVRL
jgi:hypothetical protein